MFSALFDRVAGPLRGVLRALDEHGRLLGTAANVAPLRVDIFRNDLAQAVARANYLFSMVSFAAGRDVFFRKLSALQELTAKLQGQARTVTAEISEGGSPRSAPAVDESGSLAP